MIMRCKLYISLLCLYIMLFSIISADDVACQPALMQSLSLASVVIVLSSCVVARTDVGH